jgi:hypothetical protein
MIRLFRLIAVMVLGAALGWAAVAAIFVQGPDPYGYGFAEGQQLKFTGVLIGAVAGVGAEMVIRIALRPRRQFSIAEILIGMTLLAVAMTAAAAIAQWLNATTTIFA